MKRIAIADLHLSGYMGDNLKDGLPQRLYDLFISLQDVINHANKHNIKIIDILGDINNDKDIFYTKPFILFRNFLKENSHITFNILSGNHDMNSAGDDQLSSIENFEGIPNVNIITQLTYEEENNIMWIPYTNQIVQDVQNSKKANILLSHFGLNEAQLSSGISIVAEIGLKELIKFKLVLLGHYHKPQDIKHVWYIGNLYQKDWGEKGEEKRFIVYDTDTLEVQSFPFQNYMKHIEFIIDDSNIKQLSSILEEAIKLKEQGNKVRIKNLTDKIIEENNLHIIHNIENDIANRGLDSTMSIEDILKGYLKNKKIEEDSYFEVGKLLSNFETVESLLDLKLIYNEKPEKILIKEQEVNFDF